MSYKRFGKTNFDNLEFTDLKNLKYIGPVLKQQIQTKYPNIYTIEDLLEYIRTKFMQSHPRNTQKQKLIILVDIIGELVKNPRAFKCTTSKYLIRPINRMAFNSIVDLVDYVKQYYPLQYQYQAFPTNIAGNLICKFNEGSKTIRFNNQKHCIAPANIGKDNKFRTCPCINNQNECNQEQGCKWADDGTNKGCIPSQGNPKTNRKYATNIKNKAGDWYTEDYSNFLHNETPITRLPNKNYVRDGNRGYFYTPRRRR